VAGAIPSSTTASPATDPSDPRTGRRSRSAPTSPVRSGDTDPNETVLIDGFTLWLSALLGDDAAPIDSILDGTGRGRAHR
jgi:hypothetical protein